MSDNGLTFELPKDIERHLAALSKVYGVEGARQKQEIIVNAQVRVHEEWSCDNWNGGTYGHALYLALPETIYLSSLRQKDKLEGEIEADINRMHNVQNEFIAKVFLEMEPLGEQDWREASGLLQPHVPVVSPSVAGRIWGERGYRVFLSHRAGVKSETASVKEALAVLGASCFVAHMDIEPTLEWQDEIERALSTMDAFVALLTSDFHESPWTDHEVGFALCRRVPMIAVRLGADPYGFIGRFQALSSDWVSAPLEIASLLIKQPRMLSAYLEAVARCSIFNDGNALADLLPSIERLTEEQVDRLIAAFNENKQVSGSFGFNGSYPSRFGPGLAQHLTRLTGRRYQITKDRIGVVG